MEQNPYRFYEFGEFKLDSRRRTLSKKGEQVVILPSVTNDQAKELFPQGWNEIKPYLRMTPQPNK